MAEKRFFWSKILGTKVFRHGLSNEHSHTWIWNFTIWHPYGRMLDAFMDLLLITLTYSGDATGRAGEGTPSASGICKQDFLPLWQKFRCGFLSFRAKYISNILPIGREWIPDFSSYGENMFENFWEKAYLIFSLIWEKIWLQNGPILKMLYLYHSLFTPVFDSQWNSEDSMFYLSL